MKEFEIGRVFTVEEMVTKDKSAKQVGSGFLDVYSTPSMIALMEKASFLCVNSFLDDGESTVGGAINITSVRSIGLE
jgi:fluoroacetyl-CoA thioesterase